MRYLILLARGLRIIMLICRLGWMLVAVGLIVRDMSGQELDLEVRSIVEACRHEAATAMATPRVELKL